MKGAKAVKLTRRIGILAVMALVAACADKEEILPGERLELRALQQDGAAAPAVNRALPLAIPAATSNADWTHRGGTATHRLGNAALRTDLSPLWSVGIGAGETRRSRITADPVVAGGRVFTMDAQAGVGATATTGAPLWQKDLTPGFVRNPQIAGGGGLAYGEGRLFVTTGFGTLVALDPVSGAELWTQRVDAPFAGPPTVMDGIVYAVARDASAWAIDTRNGRVLWTLPGTPSATGVMGGASPAVESRLAIFPFSSGDMVATLRKSGVRVWGGSVVGQRLGRAYTAVNDISGDPVIAGNTFYAGNAAGRVAAFTTATGERLWTAREGAMGPVVPVGNAVFLVSDAGQLVRLDAASGERVWAVDLPHYTETKEKKRNAIHVHYGPVLAGGRLIVASSDGVIRSFDPVSGALVGTQALPGGAASAPVVAGGTLYVVARNGQLHAFR